ncbi:hypothetical protein M413DRAFT_413744 [Hebeloma cylindrosporum]|uniref:Homeobox domain-containing protein n=1 Tax=Hebeloma cylindrosporum TaxID=76867 RepID=A0A0C3BU81_HEBCY|nr:hypothetical protein M413DRAFT_413744 [Hebeloma cylindrosporum h7]
MAPSPSPNHHHILSAALMGLQNSPYPRSFVQSSSDPAVDFRAFYPYTPNEVKHRKRTTSAQLKVLEAIFKKDTKPNANLRNELAQELDMTARGVQVWFQNRRAKEKIKGGKLVPKVPGAASDEPLIDGLKDDELVVIKDESILDSILDNHNVLHDDVDAFSSSSGSSTSPPQLHLITDATKFSWQNSPIEPPPDSATFPIRPPTNSFISAGSNAYNNSDLYSHRRGSLPATAFPPPGQSSESPMMDAFDPLLRRSSVDASLQRLALNPFASLARAKNSALYGPGFGVAVPGAPSNGLRHHHQLSRLPYNYNPLHQRRGGVSNSIASLPQHASMRRLSMDSRQTRFTPMSRTHQTPSPSLLTPYNAVIRASLPDHLYTISSRTVASPIPGPLPSPGFSFGAASTTPSMPSPSSGDSERNSPDSVRSFTFRGDDEDYDAYSRFGSIASIATSESSINSSYYAEIGGPAVDHHSAEDRRDSCASGHFVGMISGLDVNNHSAMGSFSPHEHYTFTNSASDGVELVGTPGDLQLHHQHIEQPQVQRQQQQQLEQQRPQELSYPSPTSTISTMSPGGTQSPSPQAGSAAPGGVSPRVPISTSSELAFALENKSEQQVG